MFSLRRPCLLLIAATLLTACGDEKLMLPADYVPLEPSMVFTAVTSPTGAGTTGAKLEVHNRTTAAVSNIVVDFTFPAGVTVEGGSAGANCGFGDATSTGYRIRFDRLDANQQCGVFMDLESSSSGTKTFSVQPGALTADGLPANEKRFTWTWTAP